MRLICMMNLGGYERIQLWRVLRYFCSIYLDGLRKPVVVISKRSFC
jgi:hypothetical protein